LNSITLLLHKNTETICGDSASREKFPSFYPGEIVTAKVIKVGEDSKILIQLKGVTLWASSRFPLSCDWEGILQVENISPQMVFKVISENIERDNSIPIWLRTRFIFDLYSENGLQKLFNLFESIRNTNLISELLNVERFLSLWKEFPSVIFKQPDLLPKFFVQSGLFFESKLAQLLKDLTQNESKTLSEVDLKGYFINLKSQLLYLLNSYSGNKKELSIIRETIETIEQVVSKIERFQMVNLYLENFREGEKMVFWLPIWFEHLGYWGELTLFFSKLKKEKKKSEDLYILFLLTLPEWGRLTIEVRLESKKLYGHILSERTEVLSFLHENLPEFYSRLSSIGFEPQIHLSIDRGVNSILMETFLGEEFKSLLNVVI
jgi:hypothetical protein